jgi:hypothetical protein
MLKATLDQSQRALASQAVKQVAEALSKRLGARVISLAAQSSAQPKEQ